MASGEDLVQKASDHFGEQYVYGALAPKNNSKWLGPWDCAEFVSWCVYQASGILYGCDNNLGNPATANAYTGYWSRDVNRLGIIIDVAEAANTIGAIVLRNPTFNPKLDGHIAITDGSGGTIEAKSRNEGVVFDQVAERRWDTGILIPGIIYSPPGNMPIGRPRMIYRLRSPLMRGEAVLQIQNSLLNRGLDPGRLDGIYGPLTAAAVVAFQRLEGLVPDGEVGPATAAALGITL